MPASLLKRVGIALLIAAPGGLLAQADGDREQTEARLLEVKEQISRLQESLENDREAFSREQQSLKELDLEIQDNTRHLRELQAGTTEQQAALQDLLTERDAHLRQLESRHAQLEAQILAAWQMGRESRLKLVLNQDSPAQSARLLGYYEYLSRAQAGQIMELKEVLAGLDLIRAGIDRELAKLAEITRRFETVEGRLQEQRGDRLKLLQGLESSIGGDEQALVELERDREDLETLLRNLSDALADIPADLGEYGHPGSQKGQLPMPIKGRVLQAFGQPRGAGLHWEGWLLEAEVGAEIRAIAYGRVAYADWLRGYGLMIIIDHGEGFMSLYGNNESLLFSVGDWVQPGAVIATVGRNPGARQGLYFELRNDGRAIDPAIWVSRR